MKKKLLLSLTGLLVCLVALAQTPTRNKYYRIVNASYGSVINENWGEGTVSCIAKNEAELSQVWQYTAAGALKNVYTGKYLQDQPNMSTTFVTGTAAQPVTFTKKSDGHLTIATLNTHYLHCDGARNVVYWWDAETEPSHWTVEEVSLTADEIAAAQEEYETLTSLTKNASKYTEALTIFFTNELCTELKAEYAAMADDALKAAMAEAGLPTMLQDIAVKVKNQWWNDTDKSKYADENIYAKDFRVASYQPYSDANNWRDKMNTYAPNFMGNPTGIYAANGKEIIHVFVGSDIPEGSTLYLTPVRNHGRIGSRSEGTELKKGYNAVIGTRDSLVYFVNYVVNTIPTTDVNAKTETIAKISDFPNLDIHIEGGQCVGYYQKPAENTLEEDEKYKYLINNANDGMYFMVKGATSLFYFKKYTYTKHFSKTIWNSINWFDRLHFWEFSIIGVLDDVANGKCENGTEFSKAAYPLNIKGGDAWYPTYCNNPTMAMEGPNGQNPHATTFYTSYPGDGGVESSFNAERANFDNWCAGHEHGHQIQGAYNLESCSESSVNLPSNIITYLTGFRLGRGWNFEQNYAYVAENKVFGLRDISITMRMYYNLFLYYHIGGKKKDFYPTFVKSLREDPMDFSRDGVQYEHPEWGAPSGGHHRAVNTWIKFYKKACDAAQEDLTEYFRMWGFFVPCDKEYFGDYTSYAVSLTQKEIDAAIAEVKAKGYPENLQIMFVEDRQIPRERTDIWAHTATGSQKYKPTNWEAWYTEEQLRAEYGDVGDILTYIDGSANTSQYTYILSGNKVSLSGKGGVGFIVYDKDGNNVYMSNRYKFEIPAEVAANGFTIKCINADGTSSVVANGADSATDEEKLAILKAAIEASKAFTSLEDATGKKVGFYSSEDLAVLKGYVTDANTAIADKNVDAYIALADNINKEILRLQSENCMKQIIPNGIYHIACVRKVSGATRYLSATTADGFETKTSNNNISRWAFVPTGEENVYYLQNRQAGKMMGAILNEKGGVDNVKMVEADPEVACTVKVESLGGGKFGIRPKDNTYLNMHNQGYITVWGSADEGSQWYIHEYETFEELTDEKMNGLVGMTEDLINDVCDYSITTNKYNLQCTDASQPAYISTNQPDSERPTNQIEKAIDGNRTTFFMSNRSNNNATEPHHLKVDLGSGVSTQCLNFYMYGNSTWNYATAVDVYASNTNTSWTKVASIQGMKVAYTSDMLKASTKYRYWRFDVVATTGQYTDNSDYPWFTVKEFELYENIENIEMKPGFESITKTMITNCKNGISGVKSEMGKTFRTMLGDYIVWTKLNSYYNNLYNRASVIDPTVDINDIEADGNADGTIYDLSGRRVKKTDNGIYIINGKKVVK
ncbi:MAG: M60 family metallopeptidase [Bacteroidaceae bacterium]|nr:M60 family metallopeptidase [Bacteroidaceae bacterium]